MTSILERLLHGHDLGPTETDELFALLTDASTPPAVVGALLAAMRAKGESATEVGGLAAAIRARARPCELGSRDGFVDVVGTGGDHAESFNLSTGAALLAAAAGARVVKHGGGAVSGRSGSADVLAALGLAIPKDAADARKLLELTGFTFLHAPHYHEGLRGLAALRRALGTRTVLNLVAPLCNPAFPPYAVIGASSLRAGEAIAAAAARLPMTRVLVIHGALGWDEPTPVGPFHVWNVTPGRVVQETRDPLLIGIPRCRAADLRGGDAQTNARALSAVFHGERGPHRDALVLGAGLALEVSGRTGDMAEGVTAASHALDDGRAGQLLFAVAGFRARNAEVRHA
jgi:anthranilate phosphoribosyltransferase